MDDQEALLKKLILAEQQFRLACTVNLAVTNNVQSLDVPVEWSFGKHTVSYEDFGLRIDQAEVVAPLLEMTATFVVAGAIRDAVAGYFPNPKAHNDSNVVSAYQISRMLRNAFSHSMLSPKWSIDDDCKNRVFNIEDVISLDTSKLHGQFASWRDYGGPLAIFKFGRYVRENILGKTVDPNRQKPPFPTIECYQQGRLIARRVDVMPPDAVEIAAGETLVLGNGHFIRAVTRNDG
ncbi:hypothetical protein [Methylosinus sp. LW4]|uniref:hypothetical protein n=1 Tax=Methylosinus sp. LW4 TaxID=136993 RepID=UPI0012FB8D18|nr:hypothetical protein [Methylosinus sp. LW4]